MEWETVNAVPTVQGLEHTTERFTRTRDQWIDRRIEEMTGRAPLPEWMAQVIDIFA